MIKCSRIRFDVRKVLFFAFLSILLFMIILPIFHPVYSLTIISDKDGLHTKSHIIDSSPNNNPLIDLKMEEQAQTNNPESFFPTFLYYSIEIANLLIENLYDSDTEIFYFSTDEEWQESGKITEKRTFDNAQTILALVKLADAVINQTERDYALNIAAKTSNGLVTNFWDPDFGGFYVSQEDRYKKPGIQGKAIQAFINLYEVTGNTTYRDLALDTFNFIDSKAWDDTKGYYIYVTSHTGYPLTENPYSGDPYEPNSLRVDHNVIMGNALLDLYRVESDELYLIKALQIFNSINSTCRNTSKNLFYTGIDTNQEVVFPEATDLFINSLVLEFLAHLYNVTEDSKYFDDFFPILNSLLLHFWDNQYGGFIATSSTGDPSFNDATKYTERQFYGIRALDEAYKLTSSDIYYNLILDTVEILNTKLYDQTNGGYYQLSNQDGTQSGDASWRRKSAVTQSLAIQTFANLWLYSKPGALNVVWSPSTPRPQDRVTLLIAAFDSVGISSVFLNYSINDEDYKLKEMVPHYVGNMFNVTLDPPLTGDGTTINFNIIITNNLNEQVIRGDYSFLWQIDIWPPEIQELGFIPGLEIPVNEEFSVFVSAHDVPTQGTVTLIRFHYHRENQTDHSLPLVQIDVHIWQVTFPDGLPTPGTYAYYFESLDTNLNPGFSHINYFYILGTLVTPPLSLIIGFLVIMGIFVPAGLYTYVEYKKKSARKTLKTMRKVRYKQRGKKLKKRGTKRTSDILEN